MADQSTFPVFDGQRMPGFNAMGNDLFFSPNEAGGPGSPCFCNGNGTGACGHCYITSPISPSQVFPSFDQFDPSCSDLTSSRLDHSFNRASAIRLPERPARPNISTDGMAAPYFCPNTEQHVASIYTPGYRQSLCVEPNETLLTPVTTAPSLNEDTFLSHPFVVKDLVSKGRERVELEYQPESYFSASELARLINDEGYRLHGTGKEAGEEGSIRALQKTLSFNLKGRVPATTEQLKSLLRSVRGPHNSSPAPGDLPSQLANVLTRYGSQSEAHFQLGLVMRGSQPNSYSVFVYGSGIDQTLWLFYDKNGDDTGTPDQWFAIIPNDSNNKGSYAAALANPAPRPVVKSAIANPPNPSLLHPGYNMLPPRGSRPGQSGKRTPNSRSVSGRHNKGVTNHGPRIRRHGSGSRAPSEAGSPETTRNHSCLQCDKSFFYPKDLRRHLTTHSRHKQWKCQLCPKEFTRKDNMNRHMINDHSVYTPPTSTIISN